ncbi:hypothetical protein WJ972_34395 [Achromobacter insuavis]
MFLKLTAKKSRQFAGGFFGGILSKLQIERFPFRQRLQKTKKIK